MAVVVADMDTVDKELNREVGIDDNLKEVDMEMNWEVGIEDNLQEVDMEQNWDGIHKGMEYIEMNDCNYYPFNNTDTSIYTQQI